MGSCARLHDLPFVALIAIGLLAAAPRACAEDMFVLNHHRPTLQSLATRPQAAATVATATADAICVFGNGFNVSTGPCASCFDSTVDFGETDVDCGGSYCKACTVGKTCLANTDCQSGRCTNNVCADVLLISQVQTRGIGGGADEFEELYNPTSVSVTFDSSWTLVARSTTSASYSTKISGGGQSIPSHGHILYTGTGYTGPTMADALLLSGITDASSLLLLFGSTSSIRQRQEWLCRRCRRATGTLLVASPEKH
jgi:hypothetical protein